MAGEQSGLETVVARCFVFVVATYRSTCTSPSASSSAMATRPMSSLSPSTAPLSAPNFTKSIYPIGCRMFSAQSSLCSSFASLSSALISFRIVPISARCIRNWVFASPYFPLTPSSDIANPEVFTILGALVSPTPPNWVWMLPLLRRQVVNFTTKA